MRKRILSTLATVALVVSGGGAAAATSPDDPPGPVERFDREVYPAWMGDGLVALAGPLPQQGCFGEGFEPNGREQVIWLKNGVVVSSGSAVASLRIWAAASIDEICETVYAGGTPELIAEGTVRVRFGDNDAAGSRTRGNPYGYHAVGELTTPEGQRCRFLGRFHVVVTPDGEVRVLEDSFALRC